MWSEQWGWRRTRHIHYPILQMPILQRLCLFYQFVDIEGTQRYSSCTSVQTITRPGTAELRRASPHYHALWTQHALCLIQSQAP